MATNTYVALDKSTVATATSSITFTGISGAYTDLYIVGSVGVTAAADILMTYNGDSTSGLYSHQALGADGATVSAQRYSNRNNIQLDYPGYAQSTLGGTNFTISVQNYSNTTIFKTSLNRFNNGASGAGAGTNEMLGVWRNTNAISSLTLTASGTTFLVGSTFSLYGIRAEGVSPAPKATGGAIYDDETYYYHAFGATGVFTPLSSLTADILVIAGGGAGSGGQGGGGGAGGVLLHSTQSLTATNYTCTIGGGAAGVSNGTAAIQPGTNGGNGTNSTFGALASAIGGGGGSGYKNGNGASGGSGGGGGGRDTGTAQTGGSGTAGPPRQGFDGGTGMVGPLYGGGGGGGAGGVGANGNSSTGGTGGIGTSTYSSWGLATGVGEFSAGTYYIAAGGGGGLDSIGGLGGGGDKYTNLNGTANTGSGGGSDYSNYGGGGSGVIIVRYAKV
jgi:hypothetical protein